MLHWLVLISSVCYLFFAKIQKFSNILLIQFLLLNIHFFYRIFIWFIELPAVSPKVNSIFVLLESWGRQLVEKLSTYPTSCAVELLPNSALDQTDNHLGISYLISSWKLFDDKKFSIMLAIVLILWSIINCINYCKRKDFCRSVVT